MFSLTFVSLLSRCTSFIIVMRFTSALETILQAGYSRTSAFGFHPMPLLAGASWKTSSFGSSFQGLRHLEQLIWIKDNWSKTSRSSSGWFRTPRFTGLEYFVMLDFAEAHLRHLPDINLVPSDGIAEALSIRKKGKWKKRLKRWEKERKKGRFVHSFWRLCPRVPRRTPSSPQTRLAAIWETCGMLTSNSWVLFVCAGADQVIEEWCLRHSWLRIWMIVKVVFGLLMVGYSTFYNYHGCCWQAPWSRTPQVSVVVVWGIPRFPIFPTSCDTAKGHKGTFMCTSSYSVLWCVTWQSATVTDWHTETICNFTEADAKVFDRFTGPEILNILCEAVSRSLVRQVDKLSFWTKTDLNIQFTCGIFMDFQILTIVSYIERWAELDAPRHLTTKVHTGTTMKKPGRTSRWIEAVAK